MSSLLGEITQKLGFWLTGKLFIALIMGILTFVGLTLLNIPYAWVLALSVALLDLIPVIGPTFALLLGVGVALIWATWVQAIWVALLYIGLQQVEAFVLEPRILARSVGLNPWLVLISILLASFLFGPLGALLAVPVLIILTVVYLRYRKPTEIDEQKSPATRDSLEN